MTFTVNPEKKRTWNHGWWRDWPQGKVGLVVAALCTAGLVGVSLYAALTIDASALAAEAYALGDRPETMRLGVCLGAAALMLTAALVLFGGTLRHRSAPERQTSGESIAIENGWLTMRYHRRLDPSPTGLDVAVAWLPGCSWWWDAKRRQLVIDAVSAGSVRDWHYDDPAREESVPFEAMHQASLMRLYPFYEPDLMAYLRQIGVAERSPRSAKGEVRL